MRKICSLIFAVFLTYSCSKDDNKSIPDTTAPEIELSITGFPITTPGVPIVVSTQIEININAEDAGGIAKIEAFIDGSKVGEDTSAPYQIIIDISTFESKIGRTNKYKNYVLKVSATDNSGNVTSIEQDINIDNTLPVITGVSLAEGAIINGDTNAVSFEASDNEEVILVTTYLNDQVLTEITDDVYEVNINTLELQDGPNTLRIEAKDAAENIGVFELHFISDNTGPTVVVSSITDGSVLDKILNFNPGVSDEYSEVASLEIFLRGSSLVQFPAQANYAFSFNPEDYTIGDAEFSFVATDALGNISSIAINTQILRLLMEVTIPQEFLSPFWTSFWILASENDGSPIAVKSVELGDQTVKLYAPSEFALDQKYMITFLAEEATPDGPKTRLTNIQGISRNSLSQLNFRDREVLNGNNIDIQTTGFGGTEIVVGLGKGYYANHYPSEPNPYMSVFDVNDQINHSFYYLYTTALDNVPYAYYRLSAPLNNSITLDKSDMISDLEIESPSFGITNDPMITNLQLSINGYSSAQEYQNGISHQLFSNTPERIFGGTYQYYLNNTFTNYDHTLLINDYYTKRTGAPLDTYTLPDWTIAYQKTGNDITLTSSGTSHTLGRVFLRPQSGDSYVMSILFDSQTTQALTFPIIPEEMSGLSIYANNQNMDLNVELVQLLSFDHISTYNEYLDVVVKGHGKYDEHSNIMESKLHASGGYYDFENFHFD